MNYPELSKSSASIPQTLPALSIAAEQPPELQALPESLLNSRSSGDLLSMMMELVESMNRASTEQTEQQILNNQAKLDKAMEDFNAKMAEALAKAQHADEKHDNGKGLLGFLGDVVDAVCGFVAEVVGTVVGTVVDFALDLALAPLDLIKGLIDGKTVQQILESEGDAFTHNGRVAQIAVDCAKGVMQFVADLVKFAHAAIAVIEAGVSGRDVGQALKAQCEAVAGSLKENILDNAAVMKVIALALKVVAVVATAISGGILAPIAIGLIILSELDQRFGLAKAAFGEEAGKAVSLGVQLAGALCMSTSGGGGGADLGAIGTIADVAVIVSAVATTVSAIDDFKQANSDADAQDLQADVQQIMQRMDRLQRVIDTLLEELGDKAEDRDRLMKDGAELFRTQGATLEATLIQG